MSSVVFGLVCAARSVGRAFYTALKGNKRWAEPLCATPNNSERDGTLFGQPADPYVILLPKLWRKYGRAEKTMRDSAYAYCPMQS